jgi:hypothetical protein
MDTASCLPALRPCPREYTRTRAASFAGTPGIGYLHVVQVPIVLEFMVNTQLTSR